MKAIHCLVLPCLLSVPLAQAADPAAGRKLVDQHCQSCHQSEVYTRPDRRVTSLPGLHKQVRRCELALGLTWYDEEIADVAAHLNQNYYHFR